MDHDAQGRRVRLAFFYPELPTSANRLYFRGTRLTGVAREYRERFRAWVAQNYLHAVMELLDPKTDPTVVYNLRLIFYMNCLTDTWNDPNTPPSRRASSRYKRVDLSNRIKLLEDCIKYAVSIDDSLTFGASQAKYHSPNQDGVFVELTVVDPTTFGVPPLEGVVT